MVGKYAKTALWGTGYYWEKNKDIIREYVQIDYFIDSNKELVEKANRENKIPCFISPDEIIEKKIDFIIISAINKKVCSEIESYIKKIGVSYEYIDYLMDEYRLEGMLAAEEKPFSEVNKEPVKRVAFIQVPTLVCNFRCSYCYLIQNSSGCLNQEPDRYPHKPKLIAQALSYSRMGGRCYFDLTSFGETLLYRDLAELVKLLLLQGHIVSVTTNGTITKVIDELLGFPDELLNNLFVRFSFHYIELEKKKMLQVFFDNVNKVKNSRASFTVMMVADDLYKPYKNRIKELFLTKVGALPQLDFVRESTKDNYQLMSDSAQEEYIQFWDEFESEKFNHRKYFFQRKITEYCYGGDVCSFINIFSGEMMPCSQMKSIYNIYKNLNESIQFKPFGEKCPCEWCINTIMWANFGAIKTEYQGPGYAAILDRTDSDGCSWIKEPLYNALNRKII